MGIEEVLAKYTAALLALPGVAGVAQGLCDGQPCIRVFLARATTAPLPAELERFPVRVEFSGSFGAR